MRLIAFVSLCLCKYEVIDVDEFGVPLEEVGSFAGPGRRVALRPYVELYEQERRRFEDEYESVMMGCYEEESEWLKSLKSMELSFGWLDKIRTELATYLNTAVWITPEDESLIPNLVEAVKKSYEAYSKLKQIET